MSSEGVLNEKQRSLDLEIIPVLAIFIITSQHRKFDCFDDFLCFFENGVSLQHSQVHRINFLIPVVHSYIINQKIITPTSDPPTIC